MNYFLLGFKQIFHYQGRATRAEFAYFTIINFLVILLIMLSIRIFALLWIAFDVTAFFMPLVITFFIIFISSVLLYSSISFLAIISLTCRRLHDLGYSGWWQLVLYLINYLINLIPMLYLIENSNKNLTNSFFHLRIKQDFYIIANNTAYITLIISFIFLLLLLFKQGKNQANQYGDNPRQ
ncbi:DUF805 domain-containing protein [Volucribacter amazonae]|uniref:DUF805 domain-containing protein n=1 Tax=Volucribacter amazonae TaxID=256731 RepID=A0A9X4SR56_9PAST|nr:DUF805 domain-containing protein [Volucribacter amazonae]MDG6896201.1 hypothetical protein [Volucribacter amazonae]